jgi:hypothetical protein
MTQVPPGKGGSALPHPLARTMMARLRHGRHALNRAIAAPPATSLLRALEREGVTHVIGLPDNATAPLFTLLAKHPRIALVSVTREGEAFGIAAGLWMGGKEPVVLVQNTGLLESGDALRGTLTRMGIPLVILVGWRGFGSLRGRDPRAVTSAREDLVRADVDSVALLTLPTLVAWGIPFLTDERDDGSRGVRAAFEGARAQERPFAFLITRDLVGA